jgi:hypothetical protein
MGDFRSLFESVQGSSELDLTAGDFFPKIGSLVIC